MTPRLDSIRASLDGVIPATIATCAPDGTPNVAYLSQVEFVDDKHVALSYQFFNTTRRNILAHPYGTVAVTDPRTAARHRLLLKYLRTETEGGLFERMKAKLAGIASHSGMAGVFRLLGSDVYEVLRIEEVPGPTLSQPPHRNLLTSLRHASDRLRDCCDLDALFSQSLLCLEECFDIRHAMFMMMDPAAARLYTVASRGYAESGVGSEVQMGEGIIGVAARERTPIRIGHMTTEYRYSKAIRHQMEQSGMQSLLETEIPFPGLKESRSQMAVPIVAHKRLFGVLFVESDQDLRFGYDDEDALAALASQIGAAMQALHEQEEAQAAEAPTPLPGKDQLMTAPAAAPVSTANGAAVVVRHYNEDDTVFFDDCYLIKGVAGNILWMLLRDHVDRQRTQFTNRELRLDPRIQLPDVSDNLEARLVLLRQRLAERGKGVRLERTGRGRFALCVSRPLKLVEVPYGAAAREMRV
jgi:adenylate cyclase